MIILLATGCNERKLKRGSVTDVTGDKRGFFCIYIPILRIVTTRRAYLSFAFRPGHLSHVAAERPMRSPTLYRSTLNTGVKYREVHRVRVWDSTAEQNSSVEKNIIKEKKTPCGDIGCRTGNGIIMQCSPEQPIQQIFHFLRDILCPHTIRD